MNTFHIRKGRDIKIKGKAAKQVVEAFAVSRVAIQPSDFRGIKPKVLVHINDIVKVGTPLLCDRIHPEIKIVSPASGKVVAINRGEKRALLEIVVAADGKQDAVQFSCYNENSIDCLSYEKIIEHLLEGGLWPLIRQRPFSKVANPNDKPKSIFVQAMNTDPLALDPDFILKDKQNLFQTGLDIIKHLTEGEVHLCCHVDAQSTALAQAENVKIHRFSGPHPTGNVSTHIHCIDPINKGDTVWYIHALDVLKITDLFMKGIFVPEHYVAITGEGARDRVYKKTIMGASIESLLDGKFEQGNFRYISGSILTGKDVGKDGFLRFYDTQITVIPEGGKREFLGWLMPGLNKYSFSKTFASSFLPEKEVSLNTDKRGDDRAIVFNHIYDSVVPLDILTYFLLCTIMSGDIEEAEKLGILECDEEDFALCSFACPSKIDVGGIIRGGLDLIEKEG